MQLVSSVHLSYAENCSYQKPIAHCSLSLSCISAAESGAMQLSPIFFGILLTILILLSYCVVRILWKRSQQHKADDVADGSKQSSSLLCTSVVGNTNGTANNANHTDTITKVGWFFQVDCAHNVRQVLIMADIQVRRTRHSDAGIVSCAPRVFLNNHYLCLHTVQRRLSCLIESKEAQTAKTTPRRQKGKNNPASLWSVVWYSYKAISAARYYGRVYEFKVESSA